MRNFTDRGTNNSKRKCDRRCAASPRIRILEIRPDKVIQHCSLLDIGKLIVEGSIRRIGIPLDEVDPRGSLDYAANITGLESKSGLFKLLLHFPGSKESTVIISMYLVGKHAKILQVTLLTGTTAVRLRLRKLAEGFRFFPVFPVLNAVLIAFQDFNCVFLRAGDLSLPPATRTATIPVFDEQMAAANFTFALARCIGARGRGVGGVSPYISSICQCPYQQEAPSEILWFQGGSNKEGSWTSNGELPTHGGDLTPVHRQIGFRLRRPCLQSRHGGVGCRLKPVVKSAMRDIG